MEEQNFKNNPTNQDCLYGYAAYLYNSGEYKELEKLFSKFLKKSYDCRFWNIYIEYVNKISTKTVKLVDVYAFVVSHFDCSYFSYEYINSYLTELINSDNIEMTRKVFHKCMIPMHNLGLLWNDYEKWENKVNKATAKTYIDQIQPIYAQSFNTYQRLLPYLENNNFFKIFDIELENPLKLAKKQHETRLNFLFTFYLNKFPSSSPLLFLYSFYLKDMAKERLDATIKEGLLKSTDNGMFSTFLSIWYSFQYNKEFFNFNDLKNKDIISINHLNWLFKTNGMDAFREKFNTLRDNASPYLYVYVSKIELYQGNNKEGAYQIFTEGIEKYKNDSMINEEFFITFLKISDDENIRRLFKKLNKTEVMWDLMIEYELSYGSFEDYKNLLLEKQKEINNKELLAPFSAKLVKIKNKGTQGIYECAFKSFGFLNLQISTSDIISEFLNKLPKLETVENVISNLNNEKIVELLINL